MLDQRLTSPLDPLVPRYLQTDSAGLLFDRLDEVGIGRLARWFVHPTGGRRGDALLMASPLLDTWLSSLEPPVEPETEMFARTAGAVTFVAGLVTGSFVVDELSGDGPFTAEPDLDDVLELLRAEMERSSVLFGLAPRAVPLRYLEFHGRLVELEPRVMHIERALIECAMVAVCDFGRGTGRHAWTRLLFFAGVIAAGVGLPDDASRPAVGAASPAPDPH